MTESTDRPRKRWDDHVRAGVAAVIWQPEGRLLVMERKGAHASGTWSLPGGGMEFEEHWREAAERETFEETGLTVMATNLLYVTNDVFPDDGQHWVTLFVACRYFGGQPLIIEPEKCSRIGWATEAQLAFRPLFPGVAKALGHIGGPDLVVTP